MKDMEYRDPIFIEDAKFIYRTNFAGDPDKDKYHNNTRRGNLTIPNEEQALEMRDAGYNVKNTMPKEGEEEGFVPTYFVPIIIGYKHPKRKPKIVLVTNGKAMELDEENVGTIDDVYVTNVNATLNPRYSPERDVWTLYVSQLYVEQDVEDDPWADRYNWGNEE
jgi:hypothetical protein